MELVNNNAKNKYIYNFFWYSELDEKTLLNMLFNGKQSRHSICDGGVKIYRVGGRKYGKGYIDICASFDIETSKFCIDGTYYSTMYCWQFGLNNNVIMGHTWDEFIKLLDDIQTLCKPKKSHRLLVAVHNLSFEFSFFRDWLNVTDSFLKEQRKPLTLEHNNFVLFIDTYALTQQSLSKLAQTYTNTQKCVGDLDYDKIRVSSESYFTPLTSEELSYCHNDVLILTEYMRYYNDTYLVNGQRPITATGILNEEVQNQYELYCDEHPTHKAHIQCCQPSKDDYIDYMTFCYRGGYVHGNKYFIDEEITSKIIGVDFTSSYPASMLYRKYGQKWRKCYNIKTISDIHNAYDNNRATMFIMTLYDVKSKGAHSIESKSKCIELDNAIIDNGRVSSCDKMTVYLTMLDLFNYERFYTWSNYEIYNVSISNMDYLPPYLLQPMLSYYSLKNELKSKHLDDTIEYKLAKSKVNSFYGLSVKRIPLDRVMYIDGTWKTADATSYEKQVEKKALVPFYGIFISAWSRFALLQTLADIEFIAGANAYYMDTDSIKADDTPAVRKIIDDYNAKINAEFDIAKKRTGCSEFVRGLGEFDYEFGENSKNGIVKRLKVLGAKRYMIDSEREQLQTIAGLPKGWIFDAVKDKDNEYYGCDPFEVFNNNMNAKQCKLTTKYIDTPFTYAVTDYDGVTVDIFEKSCVSLVETDFNMKLDETWMEMLEDIWRDDAHFL